MSADAVLLPRLPLPVNGRVPRPRSPAAFPGRVPRPRSPASICLRPATVRLTISAYGILSIARVPVCVKSKCVKSKSGIRVRLVVHGAGGGNSLRPHSQAEAQTRRRPHRPVRLLQLDFSLYTEPLPPQQAACAPASAQRAAIKSHGTSGDQWRCENTGIL